jgi:hypothetical protein
MVLVTTSLSVGGEVRAGRRRDVVAVFANTSGPVGFVDQARSGQAAKIYGLSTVRRYPDTSRADHESL